MNNYLPYLPNAWVSDQNRACIVYKLHKYLFTGWVSVTVRPGEDQWPFLHISALLKWGKAEGRVHFKAWALIPDTSMLCLSHHREGWGSWMEWLKQLLRDGPQMMWSLRSLGGLWLGAARVGAQNLWIRMISGYLSFFFLFFKGGKKCMNKNCQNCDQRQGQFYVWERAWCWESGELDWVPALPATPAFRVSLSSLDSPSSPLFVRICGGSGGSRDDKIVPKQGAL